MRIGGFGVVLAVLLLSIISFSLTTSFVSAQACTIALPYGPQTDGDCDGIADAYDNCPEEQNSDQADTNYNGRGDACDALIQLVVIQPDSHLRQGEFGHITVRVVNNREDALRDVTIRMRNDQLGIDAEQTISDIPRGADATMDFWLRIPKCAKVGEHHLSLMLSQRAGSGVASAETGSHTITVEKGDVCGTSDSALDSTIINAFDTVDLDQGESTIIPITIINLGDEQATYTIAVSGFSDAGTWRIDPTAKIIIPAGASHTANLYLFADDAAQAGKRKLSLQISAEGKSTTVEIEAYIRGSIAKITRPAIAPLLVYGLLIPMLVLLLAMAILIAIIRSKKKEANPKQAEKKSEIQSERTNTKKKKSVGVEKANTKKDFRTNY